MELGPGDVFLQYTDGVTEAMNASSEEFGVGRLADIVGRTAGQEAEIVVGEITTAVEHFMGARASQDAITLLLPLYLEYLGIIELRTLSPLDSETIAESVQKTGRVVVAEEGSLTGGIGAEIVARIVDTCFDYLQTPPQRVAAADTPVPASRVLEEAVIPSAYDIARACTGLIKRYGPE